MLRLRPASLTGLALGGFTLVALPLVIAIAAAYIYVDNLTQQSEQLILRGIELARQSRALEDKIIAMERNARQYQVLGERSLVDLSIERQIELTAILDALEQSHTEEVDNWHLDRMREDSLAVVRVLNTASPQAAELGPELEKFSRMRELAAAIRIQGDQFVNSRSEQLRDSARHARYLLLLMTVTLIPLTLLLSLFFTVQIIRPMRQIEQAIHQLGDGRFSSPLAVTGPRELEALGGRLEWLRNRLTALEEDKNRFMRRMSHELKTPLASIREGSELLRDGSIGGLSDTQREVADILHNSSVELQLLIENLLDYEEWRSRTTELEVARFPIRALISAIVQRHQLVIASKQLNIRARVEDFDLCADRGRMRMTLDNLLSNAVKFTPPGGTVYIRAGLRQDAGQDDRAVIDVADTGPGIAPADRERIFEEFYQGSVRPGGYVRGTGIGLSVVRDCVLAHGGSIEILQGEFPGAHFRIEIPSPPPPATR